MSEKKEEKSHPWRDGHYKSKGMFCDSLQVKGDTAEGSGSVMHFKHGDFGEADPKVVEQTGQSVYNVELKYFLGVDMIEYGVVSEDGLKMTLKNMMGVGVLEWITEEEADALEAEKDHILAPSHPYKEQPDNLGKFLWITGPPGLGKSTTAQLLARKTGYVYYEGDCFFFFKNPYIPVDVPEPSKAQVFQKSLRGDGLKERMEVITKGNAVYEPMMMGMEYDKKLLEDFYAVLCDDIKRERARLGGDWVVATVIDTREWRDFVRSRLGPDLVFVVLDMEIEQQVERIRSRHEGDEGTVEMMKAFYKLCEPATEDEPNAVDLKITPGLTPDEVVDKILQLVN